MARYDSVALGKQTALGTKQTTMEYFPPVESAEINANTEVLEVEETIGNRFPTDIEYGTQYFATSFAGVARVASFPRILSGFMGAPTTSATAEATAKSHLFNPVTGSLVPHSIKLNRTDPNPAITDLVWDALGNTISMSVDPNGYLTYDNAWVAIANDDTVTEPTVTADLSKRFNFSQVLAYLNVDGAGESEVKVSHFGFEYNNNLPTDTFVLGQRTLYSLIEGNADAQITFTPRNPAELSAHYRRALQATPAKCALRITATGAVIGTAVPYKFEIKFPNLNYLSAPAAISAANVLNAIEVTARAAYDPVTSKFCTIEVVNTVASY